MTKTIASTSDTIGGLFASAVDRGVRVTFMYNPTSDYGNVDVRAFVKGLDPRIIAIRVESDGVLSFPKSLFSSQKAWR